MNSKSKKSLVLSALLMSSMLVGTTVAAQNDSSLLSFSALPSVGFPLGNSAKTFGWGGGGSLAADWRLPSLPLLFVGADLRYAYDTVRYVTDTTSTLAADARIGVQVDLLEWLSLKTWGAGGWYSSRVNADASIPSAQNPSIGAGVSGQFLPGPVRAELGVQYLADLGLRSGLTVQAGVTFALPENVPRAAAPSNWGPPGFKLTVPKVDPLYPVFYRYYSQHPLATIDVENRESADVTNLRVSVLIRQFMDGEYTLDVAPTLTAGKTLKIPLFVLLNDKVLASITEGTEVLGELSVDFQFQGRPSHRVISFPVKFYDRNAMNWDDTRRAAAFVTAKDPVIQSMAKNVLSNLKASLSPGLNHNIQTALALQQASILMGLVYAPDPKTPYAKFSTDKTSVDYLQFPRQTLKFRAGDCDDLSILFCALFESVGIETAFITVPGHIYLAFSTGLSVDAAKKQFAQPESRLIFQGDQAWVPFEVTDRNGFLSAWESGAQEWHDAQATGSAEFVSVRDAWAAFAPSALPLAAGESQESATPPSGALTTLVKAELQTWTRAELERAIPLLQARLVKEGESPALRNSLGVTYARWGNLDVAEKELATAAKLSKPEYVSALVNLANIALLRHQPEKVVPLVDRIVAAGSKSADSLASAVRLLKASGNDQKAEALALEMKNAGVATTSASTDRAGNVAGDTIVWEDSKR